MKGKNWGSQGGNVRKLKRKEEANTTRNEKDDPGLHENA